MDEQQELADRFEASRPRLRAMAHRLLGSAAEADDAVQDAWLRVSRADPSDVLNLEGWFTTIVSRVCLTLLQSGRSRREQPLDERVPQPANGSDPERDAVLAESVGVALLLVLDTLTPSERLAFVLHDLFAVPFEQIATVLDRSPVAARQLASRARRRLHGSTAGPVDLPRQRAVVEAFLAASRDGDFARLLTLLDPDVVLRADPAAVQAAADRQADGAPTLARELRGAAAVARTFTGRATAAQPALIDGTVGLVWAPGGVPRAVFDLVFRADRIAAVDLLSDPAVHRDLEITLL